MDCHQTNKLMKKIEAIIKPFKLEEVKDALGEIGIEEMTVSEVKAFGRPNVHVEVYRGTEFPVGSVPEIKIELMVAENQAEAAVAAIAKGARSTKMNPGRIFVSQIDDAFRSRMEAAEAHAA